MLTCLVFLRSSNWQDLVSLQWGEVLWACCQCSLQLSTACWAQKKRAWGQAALWGEVERRAWRSEVEEVEGVEWERERTMYALGFWLPVTLTNSSSNLNFAPRCEEWGILGHWVQFRVHFEIHNEWLHPWLPTRVNVFSEMYICLKLGKSVSHFVILVCTYLSREHPALALRQGWDWLQQQHPATPWKGISGSDNGMAWHGLHLLATVPIRCVGFISDVNKHLLIFNTNADDNSNVVEHLI